MGRGTMADVRSRTAEVWRDGEWHRVAFEQVRVGDTFRLREGNGMIITADGLEVFTCTVEARQAEGDCALEGEPYWP
jgi:magnesium-transporting ATPase (P-type)